MTSHRKQSVRSSTMTQVNASKRKTQESKYNYSISASDIDQGTLLHYLTREYGTDFRVKLQNDNFFLTVPGSITNDFLKKHGYYIDVNGER